MVLPGGQKRRGRPPSKSTPDKKLKVEADEAPQRGKDAKAATSSSASSLPVPLQKANAAHYVEVENALSTILADPILQHVPDAEPLSLAEGGRAVWVLGFGANASPMFRCLG